MSLIIDNVSKTINLEKDKYIVINIPFNILDRYITNKKPIIENVNTFTIMWDNVETKEIECKAGTVINWILIKYNLYLIYSKLFLKKCIFDKHLFLSDKNSDIFTILKEPGTYIFTSSEIKNCNKKNIIFYVK